MNMHAYISESECEVDLYVEKELKYHLGIMHIYNCFDSQSNPSDASPPTQGITHTPAPSVQAQPTQIYNNQPPAIKHTLADQEL